MHFKPKTRGFTLTELLISMACGTIVLGAATSMFVNAMNVSTTVNQKAEMQQNSRSTLDLLSQEIAQAGAGLPGTGIQLPRGNAVTSKIGCDITSTCYIQNPNYPNDGVNTHNNFYGIIPHNQAGISYVSSGGNTSTVYPDAISVAYVDNSFGLQYYTPTFTLANASVFTSSPQVTFTFVPPVPTPNPLPNPWPPAAINDPQVGLKVGDLVYFSNGGSAIAEVTAVAGNVVTFADGDPLLINQSLATSGSLSTNLGATPVVGPPASISIAPLTCYRVLMVTYYVDVPAGSNTARLMRQVNGLPPVPVAEDVSGLGFTYDLFNTNTNAQTWKQITAVDPSQIRSVNITLTTKAPLRSKQGIQAMTLSTTVSAPNLSFTDRYQ